VRVPPLKAQAFVIFVLLTSKIAQFREDFLIFPEGGIRIWNCLWFAQSRAAGIARPFRTPDYLVVYPAMNRRATFGCPSGTITRLRLKQNSAIRAHLFSPLTTDTGNRQLVAASPRCVLLCTTSPVINFARAGECSCGNLLSVRVERSDH
jgi:hypothetical protein